MDTMTLDAAFWLTVAAIVALIALSAFFSGSETALTAASRGKLRAQADKGSAPAGAALRLTDDSERLIGAVLLGNNLVNILSTSLATALFTRAFGQHGVALATLVMTAVVLIFAEVLPKTAAITAPEVAASRVAPILRPIIVVLSPVVGAVRLLVRLMLRVFGVRADPESRVLSVRDEIAGAIALGHSEGSVLREDRDRLLGALDLSDRTVEEVMRHRSEVEMIDAEASPDAILTQCLRSSHTRLPIYRGDPENIVGVVHARDLLRAVDKLVRGNGGDAEAGPPPGGAVADRLADLKVAEVAMAPYFVPETTPLDEQMRQFLRRRTHFALVVDEYGALRGLITLEDIIEEIVGEIADEFDLDADTPIRPTEAGDYLVDGAMTIRDLNRATDWSLPDDEANTIAGLLIHEAQMIPAEGQVFSFHGFRFEVLARKDNRLTRLRIRPL